jgi:type II secretory pathway component PulF
MAGPIPWPVFLAFCVGIGIVFGICLLERAMARRAERQRRIVAMPIIGRNVVIPLHAQFRRKAS